MDAPLTILRGVVTFKRPLSKKLIFYDLEVADHGSGPADEAATNLWAELLVKADGDLLSQEQARAIRDAVRLGDSVEVTGRHEDPSPSAQAETSGQASALLQQHQHRTFVVQAVRVTARWSEVHPGAHFVPRPAPWSRKPQLQQLEQQPPRPRSLLPVPTSQDAQSEQAASRERGANLRSEADDANQEQQARAEGQQEAGAGPSSSSYQRLCKYWAATGRCPKGEACQFTHPPARGGASGAQQAFVQSRRAERLAAAAAQGFVHEAGDGAKRRRAAVLAEWLVATYGRDFLNSGTGVMDVAGGRGALTFHLTLHCGVRCTLVEPRRPAALSRQQHRDLAAAGVKVADFRLAQLRVRFGPELWRWGQQHAQASQPAFEGEGQRLLPAWEEGEEAEDEERGQQGKGQAGVSTSTPTEAPADAAELRDEAERLLRGCSLVVGLHPDQATDSILDFALECGKPFAIVPCCVFPRLFPHRRLRQPALDGAEAAGSAVAPGQSGPAAAGSRQSSGTSAVSMAATPPPLSQLHLRSDRGALSGEEQGQEEVPVESYTQLVAYLRQRAEDAAGLTPRARGRRRQTDQRTEQRVEQRHDTIGLQAGGSDLEEPDVAGAQEADAAEAAAVGSTAGTLLWLEEQAGRWEHCTQEAAAAGAWGQWQAEVLASAGQAAGDQGQGTVEPAAAARYACVGVAKLPFTGANQVVFAQPAEAS